MCAPSLRTGRQSNREEKLQNLNHKLFVVKGCKIWAESQQIKNIPIWILCPPLTSSHERYCFYFFVQFLSDITFYAFHLLVLQLQFVYLYTFIWNNEMMTKVIISSNTTQAMTKWKGVNKTSRVLTYSLYLFKITSLTHALHNIPRYHPSDTRDHWRLLISTKDDTIGTQVPLLYRIFASIVQNKEMQHLCPCRRQRS